MTDDEFDERYGALKAAPDLKTVINFLMGDGPLNGFQFGETPEGAGKYWWRAELRRAALSTAAQPTEEPVAYLWQHNETGRTRVVMPDGVITADATWRVVGPLVLAAATKAYAAPAPAVQPPAGIWVPTELAERVQETMGEFLMDHGWRQQDMDTSDEFGALLAAATKAAAAPAAVAEPVAWLHDDPQRYDVIHAEVKDLLVKSRDAAGYLHRPLDKSAHYTIPLYTAPAPAAQEDAVDAAKRGSNG